VCLWAECDRSQGVRLSLPAPLRQHRVMGIVLSGLQAVEHFWIVDH
jgi:hypothetical protein